MTGSAAVEHQPPERSLLQRRLLGYQGGQDRTKGEAVSTGLTMIPVGVIALLLGTAGVMFIRSYWIFSVMQLIGVGLVLMGIVLSLRASLLPEKVVSCPSCHTEHKILERATAYICPTCMELLRLGAIADDEVDFLPCPYCGHKTVVSPHHGPYPCGDCGVSLSATGTFLSADVQPCPDCGVDVPDGALFCTGCGGVFGRDYLVSEESDAPKHDMDWVAGKDGPGHLIFAHALLRHLGAEPLTPPSERHDESPLTTLERALLSLTEAASHPELSDRVRPLVPAVDGVYGKILRWEVDLLDTYERADEIPDEEYVRGSIGILYSEVQPQGESHIEVRRELERLLADGLEQTGSVGVWGEDLIMWKDEEVRSNVSIYMKNHVKVPKSAAKLRAEAERFDRWMEEQGSAR